MARREEKGKREEKDKIQCNLSSGSVVSVTLLAANLVLSGLGLKHRYKATIRSGVDGYRLHGVSACVFDRDWWLRVRLTSSMIAVRVRNTCSCVRLRRSSSALTSDGSTSTCRGILTTRAAMREGPTVWVE